MNNTRDDRFDYFKGVLMFGVIWGHAITAYKAGGGVDIWVHVFLRTYDMPFFMMISGFFLAKSIDRYAPWKNIVNKMSSILVPVLIWRGAYYFFMEGLSLIRGRGGFSFSSFVNTLSGCWFLWATFICACVMILICWLFQKTQWRVLVSVMISILLLFVPKDLWNVAFVFPFYALGFFGQWILSKFSRKTIGIIKTASMFIFVVLVCFWDPQYNVWNAGSYLLNGKTIYTLFAVLFRFFIGCTGCVSMIMLFDALKMSQIPIITYMNKEFISVGKNTLGIYIFQGVILEVFFAQFIMILVEWLNFNPFILNADFLGWVIAPTTAFICMFVLNKIIILLRKIPCLGKYIFGFKAIDAKI